MKRSTRFVHVSAGIALCVTSSALPDESLETVRASVQKLTPELSIQIVQASPVKGLYHAVLGGSSGYVSADGKYFISGDLFEVQSRTNVSEESRKTARLEFVRKADMTDTILFAPEHPKHTITIFTDVDCGYCRKLHGEMAKYNELGIAVRYVAYPRSGPGTASWATMEAVWCSRDRRDAITRAKLGQKIDRPTGCRATPIAEHYALGEKLGVQGTPMILLEDGRVLGGYIPAMQLSELLDQPPTPAPVARAAP